MNIAIGIAFLAGFAAGLYAGLHHCGQALGRLEHTVAADLAALENRLKALVDAAIAEAKAGKL
jgi:hypothetical protein